MLIALWLLQSGHVKYDFTRVNVWFPHRSFLPSAAFRFPAAEHQRQVEPSKHFPARRAVCEGSHLPRPTLDMHEDVGSQRFTLPAASSGPVRVSRVPSLSPQPCDLPAPDLEQFPTDPWQRTDASARRNKFQRNYRKGARFYRPTPAPLVHVRPAELRLTKKAGLN